MEIYMILVDGGVNSNKYYHMIDNNDGTFTAKYGRVGNDPQLRVYPIQQWDKKKNEKYRKGYQDVTHLTQIPKDTNKEDLRKTGDINIDVLVLRLQGYAKKTIHTNYTIAVNQVTPQMLVEGQKCLDIMSKYVIQGDTRGFNTCLQKLYTIIPRKMSHVGATLPTTSTAMAKKLAKEQSLLDTLRGQVVQTTSIKTSNDLSLDSLGLSIKPVTKKEEQQIKQWLGSRHKDDYVQAWEVRQKNSYIRYQKLLQSLGGNIRQECLWHGSRNENWWGIMTQGLVLRPTNAVITGKMFGYGIYFANNAHKSYGYTSGRGSYWAGGGQNTCYLALFDVLYGTPVYTDTNKGFADMTWQKLNSRYPNKLCVHAKAGTQLCNDEIIVYREEQSTIHYIVELGV